MSPKLLPLLPFLLIGQASFGQNPADSGAKVATPAATTPAADPATAQTSAPASSTPLPRYELKRKSGFALESHGRAPFWPIGWVKQGSPGVVPEKRVDIDDEMFKVTSILVGNPSMAVINGRSYEEGQFIRMPKTAPQVKPRLYRIGDGQVLIQVQNQIVSVQLKRGELKSPAAETELLNEEKDELLPVPSKSVKSASAR
jgi:hypothetical protein